MQHLSFEFHSLPQKKVPLLLTIFASISGCFQIEASVDISGFSKISNDTKMTTMSSLINARSVLECAKMCSSADDCCGYNFAHKNKTCAFLWDEDVVRNAVEQQTGTDVYVHKTCMTSYPVRFYTCTNTLYLYFLIHTIICMKRVNWVKLKVKMLGIPNENHYIKYAALLLKVLTLGFRSAVCTRFIDLAPL